MLRGLSRRQVLARARVLPKPDVESGQVVLTRDPTVNSIGSRGANNVSSSTTHGGDNIGDKQTICSWVAERWDKFERKHGLIARCLSFFVGTVSAFLLVLDLATDIRVAVVGIIHSWS